MGYRHTDNLYKSQDILLFKECYALEKIHGTSAHISWSDNHVNYSSGGEKHERFVALFDNDKLVEAFKLLGYKSVIVYGECYGSKQQSQSYRYGPNLKFVCFEVQIDGKWLAVPQAADVVEKLGLEFVHYVKVSTDLIALDAERDAPSVQAVRNGVEGTHFREGVVLRPLVELTDNSGERFGICKHKRDEERETTKPRKVVDPALLEVLTEATKIADEWVTPTRLQHVLDKLDPNVGIEKMKDVITAMTADIMREGAGEFIDSKEARAAIGKKTAMTFKAHLNNKLREGNT